MPTWVERIRSLRVPQGQSLIWRLIALERGLLAQVLAFTGFLLAFRFIFAWSWSMSLAMLLSMFLHECGHACPRRMQRLARPASRVVVAWVAVMYGGTMVEEAPVAEIFTNPKHPYTRGLLRAIPTSEIEQGELRGIPGSPPTGCRFHPRCPPMRW
jgi:hypothetical protein